MSGTAAGVQLLGVGVDAEEVRRFEKLAAGAQPWRLVFSPREAEHLASQPRPASAFCAAFCCKEAVCKALGERYPFVECECRLAPGGGLEVVPAPAFLERFGIDGLRVLQRERYPDERGECVVEAYLFRCGEPARSCAPAPLGGDRSAPVQGSGLPAIRSRLKSLAVAAAVRGREQLESRHFTAAELVELAGRRAQSLAGALALKSALAALWADAGLPPALPRDFELAHETGGAPRLVSAPPGPEGVLVSISHTRNWAYGLAGYAVPGA